MPNEHYDIDLKNKSLFEKLDMIEVIQNNNDFTQYNLKILEYLSNDKDCEVRAKVAEVLVLPDYKLTEKILVKLINDKDELVRVNACDSLCNSYSLKIIAVLKGKILKDRSSLARGYAALSIGDIAQKINCDYEELSEFFKRTLEREKVQWVKNNFYKVLYILGDYSYLRVLINQLDNRLYRNRCAVVNILADIVSGKNINLIKSALIRRLKVEKSIAVKNEIEDVIKRLYEF